MADYALTLWSIGSGWRNVRVTNATNILDAIAAAEKATGCRVSHGRGSPETAFNANATIDAESGEITTHHDHTVKPDVVAGPADVVRAIAQALKPKR